MTFSVKSLVRSAALVAAVVGGALNANAALLNLAVSNTGATTTWDAATQALRPVPTPTAPPVDTNYTMPSKAGVAQAGSPGNRSYAVSNTSATSLGYVKDVNNSQWITPNSTGIGNNAAAGSYIYQTTFSLAQATQGTIAGKIAATAGIIAIRINGVYVAGTAASTATSNPWYAAGTGNTASTKAFKTYNFTNVNLKSGVNIIQFVTSNTGNQKTGINNIFTTATAVVPEPSTFALVGMGIVGMAVARYRRRQAAV